MALDPNIPLSGQRVQYDPAYGLQAENALMTNQMNRLKMDATRRDLERDAAFNALIQADPDAYFDPQTGMPRYEAQVRAALMTGNPELAQTFAATAIEGRKAEAAISKDQAAARASEAQAALDTADRIGRLAGVMNESNYPVIRNMIAKDDPEFAQLLPEQYVPGIEEEIAQQALSVKDAASLEIDSYGKTQPYPEDVAAQRMAERQAGAPTTQILPGEAESQKLDAKYYDELYRGFQGAAKETRTKLRDFSIINRLLSDAYTGTGARALQATRKLGTMFGIDVEGVGPVEAADMLSNALALEMRSTEDGGGMPGAMSDRDREFLIAMTPNVTKTKEGRELMEEVQKRRAKRANDMARDAREYKRKNGRLDVGFEQMMEEKYADKDYFADLMPKLETATIPTPQTDEEYEALPSGAVYIDPDDGKQYRKP